MFKELKPFLEIADINITISKIEETVIVSVLPKMKNNENSKIAPLIMRGTIQQLEDGFFNALLTKIPVINALIVDDKALVRSVNDEIESAKPAPKPAPKVKEKSKAELTKQYLKDGNDAMTKKDYNNAVKYYTNLVSVAPDDKKYKDLLNAATRWKVSIDAMYVEEKTPKEVIAESNPAQASLLDHSNVIVAKIAPIEEEVRNDEGPEEGQEDNDPEEEEEFNF